MTRKTQKRLLAGAIGLTALAMLLLNYKERESYRCPLCDSRKDVFQWRLGSWGETSLPLTPKWEHLNESLIYRDFFGAGHVHDWEFAQGSPYYLFGTIWSGCTIGAGRHESDVCRMYESNAAFRSFIQTRIQNGSLTKLSMMALAAMPSADSSGSTNASEALVEDFFAQ